MPDSAKDHTAWYAMSREAVAQELDVDLSHGLSDAGATQRQEQYGLNQLSGKKKEPGWRAFLRQYRDFMQIILIGAAVVNIAFTDDWGTTLLLVGLTVLNAVLGLRQESKAEASLAALSQMMKNIARVRRDGEAIEIDAEHLVPGDIVLIEAGNRVPADGRLFVAASLEIEEAALTGESVASPKDVAAIQVDDLPLADRTCMAYMNTSVTRGRGEMIVTATGMATEMGHIADLLNQTKDEKTPLQRQLDRLVIIIASIAGLTLVLMLLLGMRQGQSFDEIFIAGIALAIAAIPTGLPVVVTTLYSIGTRILAEHNAIVKKLPAVETLGSVSAICSDKTGTLTLNKMTAREFTVPGQNHYLVSGEGYGTEGELRHDGGVHIHLDQVLLPMALCADARLDSEGELIGDPTEGALIVLAAKGGIDIDAARQRYPRVAEVPFDSDYKFMATFHRMKNEQGDEVVRCLVKGAPDVLIARGTSYWVPNREGVPITDETRPLALAENERMAQSGERVMVVARRDFAPETFDPAANLLEQVTDLTLMAMVGIVDPPRPEAKAAIADCKRAGIQVRMITGDHAVTAAAIGRELGIEGNALTGQEFAAASDEEILKRLPSLGVVARVAPEDKIRLVQLLRSQDNIVAMTGDGVNDAPALKQADIGVAMGITGTEVSKEAAVMILTDDNFATIVKAVEYGRAIYDNLFKYVKYQMTALVAFILSYLGASLFFIVGGAPFETLVVLYINFFVQLPIALALGMDKPPSGLMDRKPRPLNQPVLDRWQWIRLAFLGLLMAMGTLYIESRVESINLTFALTAGFVVFSLFNMAIGLTSRSEFDTVFTRDFISDRRQLQLYGIALLLIFLPTELAFAQRMLGLTSLTGRQWLWAIGLATTLLLVDEVIKYFLRRRAKSAGSHSTIVHDRAPLT